MTPESGVWKSRGLLESILFGTWVGKKAGRLGRKHITNPEKKELEREWSTKKARKDNKSAALRLL